jgi:hypothetical protein
MRSAIFAVPPCIISGSEYDISLTSKNPVLPNGKDSSVLFKFRLAFNHYNEPMRPVAKLTFGSREPMGYWSGRKQSEPNYRAQDFIR